MISFVVPAHNEEACLPPTLAAIHEAARATGQEYEIIVVNDASTDATPELARKHGARVIDVHHRQIAATRNSGARAAHGERIFFVDADTIINPKAVASALRVMDKGAVGGGGLVNIEGVVPLYVRLFMLACYVPAKLAGFCGGAFMFSTRAAYKASGGFDERLFWAEEGSFTLALKRLGRFVVIWQPVLTSGRRLRVNSPGQIASIVVRAVLRPKKIFTQRSSVEKIWYNSNRANDNKIRDSLSARFFNAVALIFILSIITAPLWYFIPWAQTPLSTTIGKFRFVNAIFLNHLSLIFWPITFVICLSLVRQKPGAEWLKLLVILALCFWQACQSSISVVFMWQRLFHWIAA